jgi:hypothetical protein
MLLSFDLEERQVLLLLLNQMVQVCDDLLKFCGQAMNNDNTAEGMPACYDWVTFQDLDCIEGYLRDQFQCHPAINSTFMRFLMRTMADKLAMGLKGKMDSLAKKVGSINGLATRQLSTLLGPMLITSSRPTVSNGQAGSFLPRQGPLKVSLFASPVGHGGTFKAGNGMTNRRLVGDSYP